MSMFSVVDWSKAAAAWVSQKQKLEREKDLVNQQTDNPLSQSINQVNANQAFPLSAQNQNFNMSTLMSNFISSSHPQSLYTLNQPLVNQPSPYSSTLASASILKQSWLSSNVKKPVIFGGVNSNEISLKEASNFDDLDRLLPIVSGPGAEKQKALNALVKQRVTNILINVTNSIVSKLAQETLNEAHLISAQHQQQIQQQNAINLQSARAVPNVILPSSTTRALQLQLSYAAIPVQPVILGEAGQALEEDNNDFRDEMENGNMPFVNIDEPTKGLFKRPPDELLLPEERQHVGRFNDQCIRVVCYSNLGKNLGELELNGRYTIIFGSNLRQANILDSHSSVYSQHCAIGLGYKAKPQAAKLAVPCALYLIPLGGVTKMYKPEQVPFVRHHQNITADLNANQGPFDICSDGDRKREIPIGSQVYIQLASSQRYYLIDASCWRKSYVSTGVNSTQRFFSSESLNRINKASSSPIKILEEPDVTAPKWYEPAPKISTDEVKEGKLSPPKNQVEKIIEESIKKEKDEAIIKARLYASEHLLHRDKKNVPSVVNTQINNDKKERTAQNEADFQVDSKTNKGNGSTYDKKYKDSKRSFSRSDSYENFNRTRKKPRRHLSSDKSIPPKIKGSSKREISKCSYDSIDRARSKSPSVRHKSSRRYRSDNRETRSVTPQVTSKKKYKDSKKQHESKSRKCYSLKRNYKKLSHGSNDVYDSYTEHSRSNSYAYRKSKQKRKDRTKSDSYRRSRKLYKKKSRVRRRTSSSSSYKKSFESDRSYSSQSKSVDYYKKKNRVSKHSKYNKKDYLKRKSSSISEYYKQSKTKDKLHRDKSLSKYTRHSKYDDSISHDSDAEKKKKTHSKNSRKRNKENQSSSRQRHKERKK